MNALHNSDSRGTAKNDVESSIEEVLHAALDEDFCKIKIDHNIPTMKWTPAQQIRVPLGRRKASISNPVAVPLSRRALHDESSFYPAVEIADCSVSPSTMYNYDLATWRMYQRITTARAHRAATAPSSCIIRQDPGNPNECQDPARYPTQSPGEYPALPRQVSPAGLGMSTPWTASYDNFTDCDGEIFTLDI